MNWDQITGEWKQLQAHFKATWAWAKLTNDDLRTLGAKKGMLIGKIQERYGILKDEVERQVDDWMASVSSRPTGRHSANHRDNSRPVSQSDMQPSRRS
jgi:uncharacterized protein YjbJ (UPF0337 family)